MKNISDIVKNINELYKTEANPRDVYSEGNLYKQYENTLLQFKLHKILMEWNDAAKRTEFISLIRELNENLTQEIKKVEWDLVRKGELK